MDLVHSISAKLHRPHATPKEVLFTILLLLVASAHIGEYLAGASQSWWMHFGILPIYTYVSGILLPTILLINAYILLNDNLPLTPSTLIRNTRVTWRHMASAMFYQNGARQGYRLALWALGAASAALPAWLWWLDAVAKPARLVIHLLLLHQETVWAVCLAFLALSIVGAASQRLPVTIPSGIWFDMLPWMNFAEAIVREARATGFCLTCCFAGVRALYHGALAGLLPTVLRHLLTCAGTMAVTSIYTQFMCTNLIKHGQKAALAAEVENRELPPQAPVPGPAMEGQPQMY